MTSDFEEGWQLLAQDINNTSNNNGFWQAPHSHPIIKIALMMTELSEAIEAVRHNWPESDHIPNMPLLDEELADTVIRIMDFAYQYRINLPEAIVAKAIFNKTRPFMHGKTA